VSCRIESPCHISWRSGKPLPRYRDFGIFQYGGRRRLVFLKFYIFNGRNGQEWETASLCQISSKSLIPRPRYVGFRFFKMALRWKLQILMIERINSVDLRHQAKFRGDRPNRCQTSRFLDFSKMATVRRLRFVMRISCDHPRRTFGGLYHCAQFGWNRCSSFDHARVSISRVWLENKCLFTFHFNLWRQSVSKIVRVQPFQVPPLYIWESTPKSRLGSTSSQIWSLRLRSTDPKLNLDRRSDFRSWFLQVDFNHWFYSQWKQSLTHLVTYMTQNRNYLARREP